MSISNNVKKRRTELGMSIEDFSKAVRISVGTLEKYEAGQMEIPKNNLRKIAGALRTTESELKKEIPIKAGLEEVSKEVLQKDTEDINVKDPIAKKKNVKLDGGKVIKVVKKAVPKAEFSSEEEEILSKFKSLDQVGKERVKKLLNLQQKRCSINKKL